MVWYGGGTQLVTERLDIKTQDPQLESQGAPFDLTKDQSLSVRIMLIAITCQALTRSLELYRLLYTIILNPTPPTISLKAPNCWLQSQLRSVFSSQLPPNPKERPRLCACCDGCMVSVCLCLLLLKPTYIQLLHFCEDIKILWYVARKTILLIKKEKASTVSEIIKKLLRFICISKQRLILSKESDFNTRPSLDNLVCYRTNTYTLYIRVHVRLEGNVPKS